MALRGRWVCGNRTLLMARFLHSWTNASGVDVTGFKESALCGACHRGQTVADELLACIGADGPGPRHVRSPRQGAPPTGQRPALFVRLRAGRRRPRSRSLELLGGLFRARPHVFSCGRDLTPRHEKGASHLR
ncbi:DUF6300 family protein [Streptomyces sp. NPDC002619]|uniref:DUF6300 family protein n=1 Tax=Streptomyces sp. NPDC002619 TaxID=3364655 RepID=UPI00368C1360